MSACELYAFVFPGRDMSVYLFCSGILKYNERHGLVNKIDSRLFSAERHGERVAHAVEPPVVFLAGAASALAFFSNSHRNRLQYSNAFDNETPGRKKCAHETRAEIMLMRIDSCFCLFRKFPPRQLRKT